MLDRCKTASDANYEAGRCLNEGRFFRESGPYTNVKVAEMYEELAEILQRKANHLASQQERRRIKAEMNA